MARHLDLSAAPRADADRVRSLLDRQAATFVDVRSPEHYASAHLPGALSIPIGELVRRTSELPRDRSVITY